MPSTRQGRSKNMKSKTVTANKRRNQPVRGSGTGWLQEHSRYIVWAIPLVTILVYFNAMTNPFVFDDKSFILGRNFYYTFSNIPLLFSGQYHLITGEATFRPLSVLPFFFSYSVFGLEPAGWRLFNLFAHAINGVLVYLLIATLSPKSTRAALIGGLVFSVHPAFSETINVVGFNDDIQATMFFLISLIIYIRVTQGTFPKRAMLVSLLSYVAALFSKENAVVLPLVLLAYEALRAKADWPAMAKRQAPFWIITAAFLLAFFTVFKNPSIPQDLPYLGGSLYTAIVNVPRLVLSYIGFLVVPIRLTVFHSYSAWRGLTLQAAAGAILFAGLLFGCFQLYRRGLKSELFGALLFAIGLLPVLNLVPLGIPIAERYIYLSAVGGVMFFTLSAARLASLASTEHATRALAYLGAITIVALSALTVQRNTVFNSEISLWQDAVAKAPKETIPLNNLAISYKHTGRTDKAIPILSQAIELGPQWTGPYVNLGVAMEDVGKPTEAERLYLRALEIDPRDTQANNNLGGIYNERGEPDLAVKHLLLAEELQPTNAAIQMNLGKSYELKGMRQEAMRRYAAAARLEPDLSAAMENYNRLAASSSP